MIKLPRRLEQRWYSVDIAGLDPAVLLVALFNAKKARSRDLTIVEAEELVRQSLKSRRDDSEKQRLGVIVGEVFGHPVYVRLDLRRMPTRAYDFIHGRGAAKRVVRDLRRAQRKERNLALKESQALTRWA